MCELSDEFSNSYGSMALLELYAAPRVTVTSRFDRSMSFMHVVRMLHRAFARHDSDVQDRVDRGEDPEGKPWQETLQEIFVNFFRTVGLLMSMMVAPTGAHDSTCMQRGALFGSVVS